MQVFYERINTEHLALKLNRLIKKSARYEFHKQFFHTMPKNYLVPNGLKLELEPINGNFVQEFIDNWFLKLKDHSFDLMKDIITFCNKTMTETKLAIGNVGNIEVKLKTSFNGKRRILTN